MFEDARLIMSNSNNMRGKRIVHVGMEYKGLTPSKYKLGALIGDLVNYQVECGANVRMYLPRPRDLTENTRTFPGKEIILNADGTRKLTISLVDMPKKANSPGNLEVFLVEDENLFGCYNLYSPEENWVPRWVAFSSSVLDHLRLTSFFTDIVHCHEWQTGLLPAYVRSQTDPFFWNVKTVFAPHEPLNMGNFNISQFKHLGLPGRLLMDMEYFDKLCLLKAGMQADLSLFDSEEHFAELTSGPNAPTGMAEYITHIIEYRKFYFLQRNKLDSFTLEYGRAVENSYEMLGDVKGKDQA